MPDLDSIELENKPLLKPLDNIEEIFQTAADALFDMIEGSIHESYPNVEYGSRPFKREGVKRQVHYLELVDPNGITLRIEVYFK